MSAPPSTTSTSSAATPQRSSERPWRTLSSGNTELFSTLESCTPLDSRFWLSVLWEMGLRVSMDFQTCQYPSSEYSSSVSEQVASSPASCPSGRKFKVPEQVKQMASYFAMFY